MNIIHISAFFSRYIESWESKVSLNPSWQKRSSSSSYEFHSKNGFLLTMRFSSHLNLTVYECKKQAAAGNRISDLEEFNIHDGWLRMWGKQTISPDELIITSKQDYLPQLVQMGWKKRDEGVCVGPTGELFENGEDSLIHYLTVNNPGPVHHFPQMLNQIGMMQLSSQTTNAS